MVVLVSQEKLKMGIIYVLVISVQELIHQHGFAQDVMHLIC